ncbi:BnaA02g27590D [Brassica napus]|uniref:Amidase domain-containing protein n=3 Tax=Brassica TaxID=3705 RepID=M4ECK2_BRACM|nr:unnamed protein product [Brassica napus]CDY46509.1 BnaA02g27590D [Brassica napus]
MDVVGKKNMDEFGMGRTNEASAFQVTANQWDLTRVLGGSSGSSAAAIEERLCIVSPGLDLWLNASSLDVIGCFVSTVADADMLLHAISGFESKSSTHEAASHFEALGCVLTEVSLPFFSLGVPAFYVLASSESSSNLSRYDGVRTLIRKDYKAALDHNDILISPAAPSAAYKILVKRKMIH